MDKKLIYPGSTIGILGGGQLGRMIALEGKKMGYRFICLDPTLDSPCGQVADEQIIASLDDLEAAFELGRKSDVIIYEFETIDLKLVEEIERNFYLPQGSNLLAVAQDRIREKTVLQKAGFPVVPFAIVENQTELKKNIEEIGYPSILKTATGGYDGKGQFVINNIEDLDNVLTQLDLSKGNWVLEKKLDLVSELSVIVAGSVKGEIAVYPVSENIHRDNILHKTIMPANIASEIQALAIRIAREMAGYFELKGLLVVEFFNSTQGLFVNEIAPRPHNSGHYSLDACYVSQFEQLIRSVCGLPLGSTELITPALMVNILGEHLSKIMENYDKFSGNTKIHLYGKKGDPEPKRKVGHLVIKDPETAKEDKELINNIYE